VITPEIIEQMIVVEAITQFIADVIRAVTALLLPFGASISPTVGEIRSVVTTIFDSRCLAIPTIAHAVLLRPSGTVTALSSSISCYSCHVASSNLGRPVTGDCSCSGSHSSRGGGPSPTVEEIGHGSVAASRQIPYRGSASSGSRTLRGDV